MHINIPKITSSRELKTSRPQLEREMIIVVMHYRSFVIAIAESDYCLLIINVYMRVPAESAKGCRRLLAIAYVLSQIWL